MSRTSSTNKSLYKKPKAQPKIVTQELKTLVSKFGDVQRELKASMSEVSDVNKNEIKTGFWSGLRGKTDAQIADHVKKLGLNLHTTQKVVLFLIELSHAKNEVLRAFHSTLVDKLMEFDKEHDSIAGDLSVSQQNERKIVFQIKEQIENQLELRDDIDENASNISRNKSEIESNSSYILENAERIENNLASISENSEQIKANRSEIDDNKIKIEVNRQCTSDNRKKIGANLSRIARNAAQVGKNKVALEEQKAQVLEIHASLDEKSRIDAEQSQIIASQKEAIEELTTQLEALRSKSELKIRSSNKLAHLYGLVAIVALVLSASRYFPM